MTSLKKVLSILIYENDQLLNSIFHYQIGNYENCDVLISENKQSLFKTASETKIDAFMLNLDYIGRDLNKLLDICQIRNKNSNILGYYENNFKNFICDENKFFLLKKPFKFKTLINYLNDIKTSKGLYNTNKFLMKHIIFSPSKKIISNTETRHTEHLTEKENNLLIYFYNKKNIDILKKDLLINVWGVSDEINTHTLETHIYRLKQKLNKLDFNLSFSLINKNGLYCLKYNDK